MGPLDEPCVPVFGVRIDHHIPLQSTTTNSAIVKRTALPAEVIIYCYLAALPPRSMRPTVSDICWPLPRRLDEGADV